MAQYKPQVIADVQRAIEGVNSIIVVLDQASPLSSGAPSSDFPESVIGHFNSFSQTVVDSLRGASTKARDWLEDTSTTLSANTDKARQIQTSIDSASASVIQVNHQIDATEERILAIEDDVHGRESSLSAAQQALTQAKHELSGRETNHASARVGVIQTLFFSPGSPISLAGGDVTSLKAAVIDQERAVSSIESQLAASRAQLQGFSEALARERSERSALTDKTSELRQEAAGLAKDASQLSATRDAVSDLSARIDNCLQAADGTLGSSATTGTISSVLSGLKHVAGALGVEVNFAGPLAQPGNDAVEALDQRVAAIRRSRVAA